MRNTILMNAEETLKLKLFVQGDNDAYAWIYNQYVKDLLSYGMGLGYGKEVLKDAIQDVFLSILQNRESLNEVKNIKFFLLRSLKNRLMNISRDKKHSVDIDDHQEHYSIKVTVLDKIIEEEKKTSIEQKIESMLGLLSSRQREAVYLRFIQELDYSEIGIILKMQAPSVRNLVARGIAKIRSEHIENIILLLLTLYYTALF